MYIPIRLALRSREKGTERSLCKHMCVCFAIVYAKPRRTYSPEITFIVHVC